MPIVKEGEQTPAAQFDARIVLLSTSLTATEISRSIGVEADRTWQRGQRRSAGDPSLQSHHGWELASRAKDSDGIEDHLRSLIDRLGSRATAIAALVGRDPTLIGRLWITVRIENWNPGLHLSPSVVKDISAIGLGLEVDVYCYEMNGLAGPEAAIPATKPH